MDTEQLKNILATTASISTILQFLSGTLVCQKFVQKGSTGDVSPFPFISGCLSTSLWLRYGFLINDWSVILVNTAGVTLFFAYVVTFYIYSIKKMALIREMFCCLCTILFVLYYSTNFVYEDDTSLEAMKNKVGLICCLVTVLFFASPLASLCHVVKVRSAESLPFPLILASLIVTCQWYLYGVLIDDLFIQIPNFFGAVLSAIQLSLFYIYPRPYKTLDNV